MIETHGIGPGHRLGRYELLVPVAQGGMATVWAARLRGTRGFTKLVAIKTLLPALCEDPRFEQMFLAEARLASHIRHANVCEILDLGEESGTLYIVMEWVDGEPLGAIQRASQRGAGFPASIAVRVGISAALGLHAAHELTDDAGNNVGLVHRDVSPGNILVTYDGAVKIVDFGIAKAEHSAEAPTTRIGEVKGTLSFMSPEQARGDAVDRRSDVFALGVVLYKIVSGKHPFQRENEFLTLHRIIDQVPAVPLASACPGCPPALHAAVMKALEKNPERRHATMADFAKALEQAATELPPAGTLDVAAFLQGLLGERGERRRRAIKGALTLIDERPSGPGADPTIRPQPFAVTVEAPAALVPAMPYAPPSQVPPSDVTAGAATLDEPTTELRSLQTRAYPSASAGKRGGRLILLGVGALVLVAAGTVGAIRTFRSDPPAPAVAAPVDGAAASASAGATTAASAPDTATSSASAALSASGDATAAPSSDATAEPPSDAPAPLPATPSTARTPGTATHTTTATPPPARTTKVRLPTDPGF